MATYAVEATLERDAIKTLKAMLICLDRFGKELFLEAYEHSITLRTLNAAQSAFIVFTLHSELFSRYKTTGPASVKLHLKNVTSIFRSIAGVERVWLQVATGSSGEGATDQGAGGGEDEEDAGYMRVQLQCASGLRKKFDLAFQEVTSMNAVYDKAACPHTIRADPNLILECLRNFPTTQSEVTMVATDEALLLKNEVEAGEEAVEVTTGGYGKGLRTEMRLAAADLFEYSLGPRRPASGVAVAFSQREFKAILTLMRDLEHSIVAHIECAGRPVIFGSAAKGGDGSSNPWKIECVLATVTETQSLEDDDDVPFNDGPFNDGPPTQQGNNAGTMPHVPQHDISGPSFYGQYPHHQQPQHQQPVGWSQSSHPPLQYPHSSQHPSQAPPPYSQQPYHHPVASHQHHQHQPLNNSLPPQHHHQPPPYEQPPAGNGSFYGDSGGMSYGAASAPPPHGAGAWHPPPSHIGSTPASAYSHVPPPPAQHGTGAMTGNAQPPGGPYIWHQPAGTPSDATNSRWYANSYAAPTPLPYPGGASHGCQPLSNVSHYGAAAVNNCGYGTSQVQGGSICVPSTPSNDERYGVGGPARHPPPAPQQAHPSSVQPSQGADGGNDTDTEEDEDAVPGTPPDGPGPDHLVGEPW